LLRRVIAIDVIDDHHVYKELDVDTKFEERKLLSAIYCMYCYEIDFRI